MYKMYKNETYFKLSILFMYFTIVIIPLRKCLSGTSRSIKPVILTL